ncbi:MULTISPECIES: hypothetical protein [Ramlibacter]|nr:MULTISPECIES: hypothetical protein [Ramlibacter]
MMNHLDMIAGLLEAVVFPTLVVTGALAFSHRMRQARALARVQA